MKPERLEELKRKVAEGCACTDSEVSGWGRGGYEAAWTELLAHFESVERERDEAADSLRRIKEIVLRDAILDYLFEDPD